MRSTNDHLARAKALYERRVTPQRTRDMRGLLDESAAETAAYTATTILCEYLNAWQDAEPAEVARAEAAIEQALERNPQLYLAHYAKGFVCRHRGQHQDALEAFEKTIECAPEFARAYAQKGDELVYLGRPEEGIAEVKRALEMSPNSSVRGFFYWAIGRARFFMGDDAKAICCLQSSVRNWSDVWYNRFYLVSAHAHSNQRAAARRVLQAAYRKFPGYTLARIIDNEGRILSKESFVIAGRERFHDGLRLAGVR
jgi:tetratricopeptide (TPR) repeat protein